VSSSLRSQIVPRVAVVAVVGASLAMLAARTYGMPWSVVGLARAAVSLGALAIMLCAKRHNIARRALLAFALETAGGVVTFAYVDAPFVRAHGGQIAASVAAVYVRATGRNIVVDLAGLKPLPALRHRLCKGSPR